MKRFVALAGVIAAVLVATAAPAGAHPLGNFTVNRATAIVVHPGEVALTYTIDMAEIPTFQEMPRIDTDGDGSATVDELAAWASLRAAELLPGLAVRVDGEPVALGSVGAPIAVFVPGEGGLQTLRLEARFTGPIAAVPDGGATLSFNDETGDDRLGWREVSAVGDGMTLVSSTVPSISPSDGLRTYPDDALSSPPAVTSMQVVVETGGPALGGADATTGSSQGGSPIDRALGARGGLWIVVGLVIAAAVGAWHALLPGHGKTLMAGAMVGGGARGKQVVVAAVAVAAMHTGSVLLLGLAVVVLAETFRPETLYPWLGAVSGLAAAGVGIYLVRIRWRAWRGGSGHRTHPHEHEHDDDHAHAHSHDALPVDGRLGARGLAALALAGGVLPAPSALLALLAAVNAQRPAYGLALVAAFSVGLALSLLVVGIGAVRVRDALARRSASAALVAPLVSAAAIVMVGAALTVRAAFSI